MIKQKSLFTLLILVSSVLLYAQENPLKQNRFFLEYGVQFQNSVDSRFSARTRNYLGFHTAVAVEFLRTDKIHRLEVRFSKNFNYREHIIFFEQLLPELRYTFLKPWKTSNLLVGGYADIGSYLAFPVGSWRGNNNISYTMWNSYGLSTQHQHTFSLGKLQLQHRTRFSIPLLAYVVHPSYGLPYPESYLEDGVFDFQRNGMATQILTSGKIYTLNRFQHIEVRTGVALPFRNNTSAIGIDYQLTFLQFQQLDQLRQIQHNFLLTIKL